MLAAAPRAGAERPLGAKPKRVALQPPRPVARPCRRPLIRAAARDAGKPSQPAQPPSPRSSGRLARLWSWRSAASAEAGQPAAAAEPQVPAPPVRHHQRQQKQAPAAAATAQSSSAEARAPPTPPPASSNSLYSWLTWGSGSPAAAATTSASASTSSSGSPWGDEVSLGTAAELGDGMAAAPSAAPAPAPPGTRRPSWYHRTRSSLGSLASSLSSVDDAEAAALASAQVPRPDHPALQLLRARALEGSRPGARTDAFKLGLVVEGGGMRGCVSGGALQALADLGWTNCFDAVFGSSAGAINATYFISGQRSGVDIYHQELSTPDFISIKNLWASKRGSGAAGGAAPVLNLSYLIDHVMEAVHPLDWGAVLDSPLPLKVVASSLDSLSPVLLEGFACKQDLAESLKASATVPEIAGGPRLHRGHRLVDAAVFEPVPFRSAIADGCTHLLVLCTRPTHLTRRSRMASGLSDVMEVAIKKAVLSPAYMRPAWQAEVAYLQKDGLGQDDQLLKALTHPAPHELAWFSGAHVYPLYPGAAANFSPLCVDVPILRGGVAEGRRNVLALAQALVGDVMDLSRFHAEAEEASASASNIVAAPASASRGARAASARLWQRYVRPGTTRQP